MLQKFKENKYTYLAVGIVAGLVLAYAYQKYFKKD